MLIAHERLISLFPLKVMYNTDLARWCSFAYIDVANWCKFWLNGTILQKKLETSLIYKWSTCSWSYLPLTCEFFAHPVALMYTYWPRDCYRRQFYLSVKWINVSSGFPKARLKRFLLFAEIHFVVHAAFIVCNQSGVFSI